MVGRFNQEDIYSGDGLNLYAYCGNNPVRYWDPSGYNEEACGGKIRSAADGSAKTKTYQTYTKTNLDTGEVYSGRTSGYGTPDENVANRDRNHHMNDKGFGKSKLDVSSSNYQAIRGREQMLIEANGGAKSVGGSSGNAINGIGPNNQKSSIYINASKNEFGNIE